MNDICINIAGFGVIADGKTNKINQLKNGAQFTRYWKGAIEKKHVFRIINSIKDMYVKWEIETYQKTLKIITKLDSEKIDELAKLIGVVDNFYRVYKKPSKENNDIRVLFNSSIDYIQLDQITVRLGFISRMPYGNNLNHNIEIIFINNKELFEKEINALCPLDDVIWMKQDG